MKITRVLNTNSILTTDENGDEIVLLGSAIGFKHRPGDEVDLSKIEKRFVMKQKEHQSRFQELVNSIPTDYIIVAEQIITLGKTLYEMKLAETIHISLADHIHTAVENMQMGIQIPNSLLIDIKRFYKNEYDVAKHGLTLIKDRLDCELPEDEAGFIAMHFVNAQSGGGNINIKKMISLVREVNELVCRELDFTPDEDSLNYFRYMTHLKFFAQRVIENIHYTDSSDKFLDTVLPKIPKAAQCSQKICDYIEKQYHYKANHDEMIYLSVHLAHITNN